MKIPIPEVEQNGYTEESLLKSIIQLSNLLAKKARANNPSQAIDNIDGYFLLMVERILIQAQTTLEVIEKHQDYNTVCALVRLMADNICIVKLIYDEQDINERELRHYLYLMDGLKLRKSELEKPHKPYDGRISKDAFDQLMKQMTDAIENTNTAISVCMIHIRNNPLYAKYPQLIEKLAQQRNWQYDNLNAEINKIPKPKWNELYKKVGLEEPEMYSYLSQYVHGLSISNLPTTSIDDYNAPCSFAVCLMGSLFQILKSKYETVMHDITYEELLALLSACPEKHLKELFGKLCLQNPKE